MVGMIGCKFWQWTALRSTFLQGMSTGTQQTHQSFFSLIYLETEEKNEKLPFTHKLIIGANNIWFPKCSTSSNCLEMSNYVQFMAINL